MSLIDLLGRGFGLITPEDPELPEIAQQVPPEITSTIGCTDPKQKPSYIIPGSFGSVLDWTVRDIAGKPIVIDSYGVDPGEDATVEWTRAALFHDPFCNKSVYLGRLAEGTDGRLNVFIPPGLDGKPGLYEVEVHWSVEGDQHYFNTAFVSIEDTIYNRIRTNKQGGPLKLSRIRNKLRDYAALNDSSGFPEFSLEEIVSAMLEPVEYYNEALPHVQHYTPTSFPYRQQWLDATVSRLLQTTAIWMSRNHVQLQGEGVGADDRGHWKAMLQLSDKLWREYKDFVQLEKSRLNTGRGYGII